MKSLKEAKRQFKHVRLTIYSSDAHKTG